jgi:replicative DNA helicase
MQISAPIFRIKRQAKLLAREAKIPLHQALDQQAIGEGFQSWSHLSSSVSTHSPAEVVLRSLDPGDVILIGARPGHGKTLLGLEMAAKARQLRRKGFFFTLDYHERDVTEQVSALGIDPATVAKDLVIDTSDDITADYVIQRVAQCDEPALSVIDYLQVLDQKRTNPDLKQQISALQRYAKATGFICAVISQIDRSFDLIDKTMPDTSDVRLPNPLDLTVFDKVCFLHNGEIRLS